MDGDGGVVSAAVEALWLALRVAGLPLMAMLAVGLVVSVLQALTQVQEPPWPSCPSWWRWRWCSCCPDRRSAAPCAPTPTRCSAASSLPAGCRDPRGTARVGLRRRSGGGARRRRGDAPARPRGAGSAADRAALPAARAGRAADAAARAGPARAAGGDAGA